MPTTNVPPIPSSTVLPYSGSYMSIADWMNA